MLLNPDEYEDARQSRDARFDGRFFVGVLTTGIYCRPVCPVKVPMKKNIQLYPSAAAAVAAGTAAAAGKTIVGGDVVAAAAAVAVAAVAVVAIAASAAVVGASAAAAAAVATDHECVVRGVRLRNVN